MQNLLDLMYFNYAKIEQDEDFKSSGDFKNKHVDLFFELYADVVSGNKLKWNQNIGFCQSIFNHIAHLNKMDKVADRLLKEEMKLPSRWQMSYLQKVLEEGTNISERSSKAARICYALHLNDNRLQLDALIYLVENPGICFNKQFLN